MPTPPLHRYQELGIKHLHDHPRGALFAEMGLGKSRTVLEALEPEHLPALVTAPKRVAENVWTTERDLWRPDLSIVVAKGTPAQRRAALAAGADITVIGRDNLADAQKGPWRTLVIDELSGFKSKTTGRWKAARKIEKELPYVWGLTGTPASNGLIDLWSQVALLDHGQRLGKTLTAYRERYFTPGRQLASGVITEWKLRPGAEARIHTLLSDICLSQRASELLPNLPPITRNIVAIQLPPASQRAYDQMKKDLVADLSLLGGVTHTAPNAAVATGKLSQITAGFIYGDPDMGDPTQELHDEKLKAVQEIIDGTGSPVLVFYRFKHELAKLQTLPGAETIDADGAIRRWNAGQIPLLLAHPASAGHGLNLQHGGHTIVWTTPPWSLEEHQQANARLARQGQRHPVIVHYLVAPDSVDGAIIDRLDGKASVQDSLLKALDLTE